MGYEFLRGHAGQWSDQYRCTACTVVCCVLPAGVQKDVASYVSANPENEAKKAKRRDEPTWSFRRLLNRFRRRPLARADALKASVRDRIHCLAQSAVVVIARRDEPEW